METIEEGQFLIWVDEERRLHRLNRMNCCGGSWMRSRSPGSKNQSCMERYAGSSPEGVKPW